jgi:hypothetical protein
VDRPPVFGVPPFTWSATQVVGAPRSQ